VDENNNSIKDDNLPSYNDFLKASWKIRKIIL
jgi:hypothetical protein